MWSNIGHLLNSELEEIVKVDVFIEDDYWFVYIINARQLESEDILMSFMLMNIDY